MKPRDDKPSYLKTILSLVCANYFCNCLFHHMLKTSLSAYPPLLHIPFNKFSKFSRSITFLYLPCIFLGIFAGSITDILDPQEAFIIFSMVANLGVLSFVIFSFRKVAIGGYFTSLFIYGVGQNLSKIPMQKITSILFAGPHLAFAINLTQFFSHFAGIVSSQLSKLLLHYYSIGYYFLIVFLISFLSLPIGIALIYLSNKKKEINKNRSKGKGTSQGPSMGESSDLVEKSKLSPKKYRESLRKKAKLRRIQIGRTQYKRAFRALFFRTDWSFFMVLLMGFFIDGAQVSFKNLESFIYKDIYRYNNDEIANIMTFMKLFNVITIFSSMVVDKLGRRDVFFVITSVGMLMGHLFYWLSLEKYILPGKVLVVIVGASVRLIFACFTRASIAFLRLFWPRK